MSHINEWCHIICVCVAKRVSERDERETLYACKHVYIHTHIHTCIHTYTHIYICTHTKIYTYIRTYIQVHIYTCIHTCIHICVYTYTNVYMYTYIQCIQTHMHTCIHTCKYIYVYTYTNIYMSDTTKWFSPLRNHRALYRYKYTALWQKSQGYPLALFSGLGWKLSVSEIFQFYPEISTVTLGSQVYKKEGTSKGPYRSRLTSSCKMLRSAPPASGKSISLKIKIQKFRFQTEKQKKGGGKKKRKRKDVRISIFHPMIYFFCENRWFFQQISDGDKCRKLERNLCLRPIRFGGLFLSRLLGAFTPRNTDKFSRKLPLTYVKNES